MFNRFLLKIEQREWKFRSILNYWNVNWIQVCVKPINLRMISNWYYLLISLPITVFIYNVYLSALSMDINQHLILLGLLYLILTLDLIADSTFRRNFILLLFTAVPKHERNGLHRSRNSLLSYPSRPANLGEPFSTSSWQSCCSPDPFTTFTTTSSFWSTKCNSSGRTGRAKDQALGRRCIK